MQMTEIKLSLSKCKSCFSLASSELPSQGASPRTEMGGSWSTHSVKSPPSKTLKRKATREGSETLRQELVGDGGRTRQSWSSQLI